MQHNKVRPLTGSLERIFRHGLHAFHAWLSPGLLLKLDGLDILSVEVDCATRPIFIGSIVGSNILTSVIRFAYRRTIFHHLNDANTIAINCWDCIVASPLISIGKNEASLGIDLIWRCSNTSSKLSINAMPCKIANLKLICLATG